MGEEAALEAPATDNTAPVGLLTSFRLLHQTNVKMPQIWMLLLLSCCGWVTSAPKVAQSVHLTVAYGESVLLPCNGSDLVDEEDAEVYWEAVGSDVASITGNIPKIEERYWDRVRFSSEEQMAAGDWSIVLNEVVLSDSDMYECIYRGRRTLSIVWLTVEHPEVDSVMEVHPDNNDPVILPCYLELPRNQPPDDLNVWWEKDGEILLEREGPTLIMNIKADYEEVMQDFSYLIPRHIDKFPLFLTTNMSVLFPGDFNCWYRTKKSDDPKPGIPGTISLYVKESIYDIDNTTESSTEEWGSTPFWVIPFGTEVATTVEMPLTLNQDPSPLEESTEHLPMEANEETATSFPDGGDLENLVESMDWADFPWVRTGLIAGVLLATVAVLCILGALHKL